MSSLDPKTLRQMSADAMASSSVLASNSNLARDNRYLQVLEHILSKNAELIKTEAKRGDFNCRLYVDDCDLRAVGEREYFIELAKKHLTDVKGYKDVRVGYEAVFSDFPIFLPFVYVLGLLLYLGFSIAYPNTISPLYCLICFLFFNIVIFMMALMKEFQKECLIIHLSWQADDKIEWRG